MHPRLQSKVTVAALMLALASSRTADAQTCLTPPDPKAIMHPPALRMAPNPVIMLAIDANGDGDVTRVDAMEFHGEALDRVDANGDGKITRQDSVEQAVTHGTGCAATRMPEFE